MATEEVNKPPSLTPYPEMIIRAIESLNDPNGSNKSSISKYIESTYGDVPAGHSALLSHHLTRMRDTGELVFWKNNYSKADPNAPPRRGRGRPPKRKYPLSPDTILGPVRPRGRPPKDQNAPPKSPKVKVSSASDKPRGRPRKMVKPTGGLGGSGAATVTATSTGRPPKVKTQLTEVSVQQ
ncbi:HMG-Y-related protein A-like [Humulus lupulus]|uniref:HMG-Y-related protein A-like n=1 Tax=Humulus lupulus TaxID=3486 RepID=UPI002B412F4F|nr:HMG-Y-related protein A-like [Humulus lupulus]XP_062107602.1 HMG-Y-related protein A-like [Humulus lupulus]